MITSRLTRLAYTAGEPAGIGPDLILLAAQQGFAAEIVVIGSRVLLEARAQQLGLAIQFNDYAATTPIQSSRPNMLSVCDIPLSAACTPGVVQTANASYVLATLDRAIQGCLQNEFDAWITGPVHKGIINQAGISFSGHTEYLANQTHTPDVVMMLVANTLRVALVTTHLPLQAVADAITSTRLESILGITETALRTQWNISQPRLRVCGLNPHAGEGGHLGREEIEVITPVIKRLQQEGRLIEGPVPADTAFTPHTLKDTDVVIAMYHDQGLPVLKYAGFGHAVNVTLGLPFIRTSVDHGTALPLAGTGKVDYGSLLAAIELAAKLATKH